MASDRSHLREPPPSVAVKPLILELEAGRPLLRVYDERSKFRSEEVTFRAFGPLLRFDHHLPNPSGPAEDPTRAVWYSSLRDIACALVEVFADQGFVVLEGYRLARPVISRKLRLLDLRGSGAMRAGTVAEVAKTGNAAMTWAWARHFYETNADYGDLDGLAWLGAHNDGPCVMLFERASPALDGTGHSLPLTHPALRDSILRVVEDHNIGLSLKRL